MRYDHREIWPDFERAETEFEKRNADYLHIRRRITIRNRLPAIARKFFQGFVIYAIEEVKIYEEKQTFTATTTLDIPGNLVFFDEASTYVQNKEGFCKRTVELKAEIMVPVAGPIIEKLLIKEFTKESNADFRKIEKLGKELFPKEFIRRKR